MRPLVSLFCLPLSPPFCDEGDGFGLSQAKALYTGYELIRHPRRQITAKTRNAFGIISDEAPYSSFGAAEAIALQVRESPLNGIRVDPKLGRQFPHSGDSLAKRPLPDDDAPGEIPLSSVLLY